MKPILATSLVFLILLCGCSRQPEATLPPTDPPVTEAVVPTMPASIYDAGSYLEEQTAGALRMYPLKRIDSIGFRHMGNDLLLFSAAGGTTLTKYTSDTFAVAAVARLNCYIYPTDPAVQVSEHGVTYYDERQRSLVFLDDQLSEVRRIPLPDAVCSMPALSADCKYLYYCTDSALRCIDLDTGLDRFLKEVPDSNPGICGLYCNDTAIGCSSTDESGRTHQLYISTGDGRLLHQTDAATQVWTEGATYFAIQQDGIYQELLTGDSEQGPTLLSVNTLTCSAHPALEAGGIVVTPEVTGGSLQLDFYHLQNGKRSASVTLPGSDPIWSVRAVEGRDEIWFLRYDSRYKCDVLHCWTPSMTPTNDSTAYMSARYTADRPDWNGIAACREIADTLFAVYGVQILLWTDATVNPPHGYTLVPEYQVPVIRKELAVLEEILYLYPENFLRSAALSTPNGHIQISLVRRILEDATSEEITGLQHWDDNANAYLCLAVQENSPVSGTLRELFHIIDSRVITLCTAYDDWEQLNPKGFRYGPEPAPHDSRWLSDAERAFVDTASMRSAREDRARLMACAMMDGNAHIFESETMQKKLRQLCLGIRTAFDLKNFTQPLLWEQYLKTPLK